MIDLLPALTPDPERSARVMAQCHAKLASQRRRIGRARRAAVESATGAALCVIYAAMVIVNAFRMIAHS